MPALSFARISSSAFFRAANWLFCAWLPCSARGGDGQPQRADGGKDLSAHLIIVAVVALLALGLLVDDVLLSLIGAVARTLDRLWSGGTARASWREACRATPARSQDGVNAAALTILPPVLDARHG